MTSVWSIWILTSPVARTNCVRNFDAMVAGNQFSYRRDTAGKDPEGPAILLFPVVGDNDLLSRPCASLSASTQGGAGPPSGNGSLGSSSCLEWNKKPTRSPPTSPPPPAPIWRRLDCPTRHRQNRRTDLVSRAGDRLFARLSRRERRTASARTGRGFRLPKAKDALLASAALGRQVAALLDTETPVPGVTAGKIRDELKTHRRLSARGRETGETRSRRP